MSSLAIISWSNLVLWMYFIWYLEDVDFKLGFRGVYRLVWDLGCFGGLILGLGAVSCFYFECSRCLSSFGI